MALEADEHGQGRLVADVVPAGRPPDRGPAVRGPVVDAAATRGRRFAAASTNAAEIVLRDLWAGLRGLDRPSCDETYWQAFSFLRALDRAHDCGVAVASHDVTANRTLAALEAALAAGRVVHRAE